MSESSAEGAPARRWGSDAALADEDEARRRLLDAVQRCLVRRGSVRITMAEVADEAGVARSTLYRYFATRDELLLELVTRRTDAAFARIVAGLPDAGNAVATIPELILRPVDLVAGNPLNEALFAPESRADLVHLDEGPDTVIDVVFQHLAPLFGRWQAEGQVFADLDVRETVRWLNLVSRALLAPPWTTRSRASKRHFIEQYVVRALVPPT